MWIVTRIGFFNIIEQDDDREKGLLTVKARSREDLQRLKDHYVWTDGRDIEESLVTDYRFRFKAPRKNVEEAIMQLVSEIDYGKTKPAISKDFPERSAIYLAVWDTLLEIQWNAKESKDQG